MSIMVTKSAPDFYLRHSQRWYGAVDEYIVTSLAKVVRQESPVWSRMVYQDPDMQECPRRIQGLAMGWEGKKGLGGGEGQHSTQQVDLI